MHQGPPGPPGGARGDRRIVRTAVRTKITHGVRPGLDGGQPRREAAAGSLVCSRLRASSGDIGVRCTIAPSCTTRSTSCALCSTGTPLARVSTCLLYTSDAADDLLCVDLG